MISNFVLFSAKPRCHTCGCAKCKGANWRLKKAGVEYDATAQEKADYKIMVGPSLMQRHSRRTATHCVRNMCSEKQCWYDT